MIVDELVKIQKKKRLTNKEFAESLGIHTISWYRNKRTKIIDPETTLKAFDVYPEFRDGYLSQFNPKTSQDGKLARFMGWLRDFLERRPT